MVIPKYKKTATGKKWEFLRNLPPLSVPNDLLHIPCHYIATTVTIFSALHILKTMYAILFLMDDLYLYQRYTLHIEENMLFQMPKGNM